MAERRDLPLFAHADALQDTARAVRRRVQRRFCAALALGSLCLLSTIIAPPLPRLVWNASASAPIGLYAVAPGAPVARGDLVIARTPIAVRDLAARRRYVPANVPLVKRVAGVPGDRLCAVGMIIQLNGRRLAARRAADSQGRALPWWTGCRTLGVRALFLLMAEAPDSFDGRYFGPNDAGDIVGKATPLWVR